MYVFFLFFFYLSSCSTSAEDLQIYSRSVFGKDDKTIAGLMASKNFKEGSSERKS